MTSFWCVAVCTFTNPASAPATDPESVVHWVFTGTEVEPVLIGVMTGLTSDWDAVAAAVAKVEPCPRPSDDPAYR